MPPGFVSTYEAVLVELHEGFGDSLGELSIHGEGLSRPVERATLESDRLAPETPSCAHTACPGRRVTHQTAQHLVDASVVVLLPLQGALKELLSSEIMPGLPLLPPKHVLDDALGDILAWSHPGTKRVEKPSCGASGSARSRGAVPKACPQCRAPVTFGGGMGITKEPGGKLLSLGGEPGLEEAGLLPPSIPGGLDSAGVVGGARVRASRSPRIFFSPGGVFSTYSGSVSVFFLRLCPFLFAQPGGQRPWPASGRASRPSGLLALLVGLLILPLDRPGHRRQRRR